MGNKQHSRYLSSVFDFLKPRDGLKQLEKYLLEHPEKIHLVAHRLANETVHAQAQIAIVALGGTRLIKLFCQNSNVDIKHCAIHTISNLASNEKNRDILAKDGWIEILIQELWNENLNIRIKAGRALANLSVNDEIKVLIAKRGAIKACIRILENKDEYAALVEALATLGNLAVHDSIEVAIGRQNGLAPIVKLLTSEHDGVKHQAERAIHNLSKSGENRKVIDSLMMKVDDEFIRSRRPSLILPPPIPPEDGGYQPLDMLVEETLDDISVPTYDNINTELVKEALLNGEESTDNDSDDSFGGYDEIQLPPLPPMQQGDNDDDDSDDSDDDDSDNNNNNNDNMNMSTDGNSPSKRRKSSIVAPPQMPPPQVPPMTFDKNNDSNQDEDGDDDDDDENINNNRRSRRSTVGPPPSPPTIDEALNSNTKLSPVEEQVFNALNLARTRPWEMADLIESRLAYIGSDKIFRFNWGNVETIEGRPAFQTAMEYLRSIDPMDGFRLSNGMTHACQSHVQDIGSSGNVGHVGSDGRRASARANANGTLKGAFGEAIEFGPWQQGADFVIGLIVDDGRPSRDHRQLLFNPKIQVCGVGVGSHTKFGKACVMTLAHQYEEFGGSLD